MNTRKTIRESLGITQTEMASLLQIHRAQWSMYESGKRSLPIATTAKLAEIEVYLQSPQVSKTLATSKETKPDLSKPLQARLKETQFQLTINSRKIAAAEQKQEKALKALQLIQFLKDKAKKQKDVAPPLVTLIENKAKKNGAPFGLAILQLEKELLLQQEAMLTLALKKG